MMEKNLRFTSHIEKEILPHLGKKLALQMKEQGKWQRFTFNQIMEKAQKQALILTQAGIQKGDRVIVLSKNRPEVIIALLSIWKAECTAVFLDPGLPAVDLAQLVEKSDARALLLSDTSLQAIPAEIAKNLCVRNMQRDFANCAHFPSHVPTPMAATLDPEGDVGLILYTSGTTGNFKGVMLTHRALLASAQIMKKVGGLGHQDEVLCILPLYHVFSLVNTVLTALYCGATLSLIENLEPSTLSVTFQEVRPTIFTAVPRLIELLEKGIAKKIKQKPVWVQQVMGQVIPFFSYIRALSSWNMGRLFLDEIHEAFGGRLTRISVGGAALDPKLEEKMEGLGFTLLCGYGLTETCGGAYGTPVVGPRKLQTAGLPLEGIEVKIKSKKGQSEGEICLRGPTLMKGYFRDPVFTKQVLKKGFFHTGDLGYVDEEGFLHITGRIKNIIVTASGKKAMPENVESHYQGIEGIQELAVVGISPFGKLNDQIHMAVVLEPSLQESFSPAELQKHIEKQIWTRSGQLPPHLYIHHVHILDALPKTNTLKIKRHILKEQLEKK